jgi:hypothetical protein
MFWLIALLGCFNSHYQKESVETMGVGSTEINSDAVHFIQSELVYDLPTELAVETPKIEFHPGRVVFSQSDSDSVENKAVSQIQIQQAFIAVDGLYEPVVEIHTISIDGRILAVKYFGYNQRLLFSSRPKMIPR